MLTHFLHYEEVLRSCAIRYDGDESHYEMLRSKGKNDNSICTHKEERGEAQREYKAREEGGCGGQGGTTVTAQHCCCSCQTENEYTQVPRRKQEDGKVVSQEKKSRTFSSTWTGGCSATRKTGTRALAEAELVETEACQT
jgi:hypothetical protein